VSVEGLVLPRYGNQEPNILTHPPRIGTYGQEAVELAQRAGLDPDPWQSLVLDNMLGYRQDMTWAAFEVGLITGRQNGKDGVLEARELWGLFLSPDDELIIHSAHLFDTSIRHFNRVLSLIEGCPDLDRYLSAHRGRVARSHGEEGIEIYRDGALRELRFRTRTKGGGRGWSCDCLILNEAMILEGVTVGAILPTLSAVPNPQVIYAASAGNKESTALGRVRSRGLGAQTKSGFRYATDPRLCFMEWSITPCSEFCPPTCEDHDQMPFRYDPKMPEDVRLRKLSRLAASYAKANPAWGIRMGGLDSPEKSWEHIESERRIMDQDQFEKERLGIGDYPVDSDSWLIINELAWKTACDVSSQPDTPLAFALDLSPDRKTGAIVVAGWNEGHKVHVEITGRDVLDHRPAAGDAWMVPRMVELYKTWSPSCIVIDKATQAGTLIKELKDLLMAPLHPADRKQTPGAGLTKEQVDELLVHPTAREYAHACGWFAGAVMPPRGQKPTLVHRDQTGLTAAVAGACKRELADLWAWDRKTAVVDLTPLVAATNAAWGLREHGEVEEASEPWVVAQ
jgi:hypothetical protein